MFAIDMLLRSERMGISIKYGGAKSRLCEVTRDSFQQRIKKPQESKDNTNQPQYGGSFVVDS